MRRRGPERGAPPLPGVAGGHGGGRWWLPCAGSWGGFGGSGCGCSCSTRRRLAKHLGCVRPCSKAVRRCGATGCSVLVWGHLGADTQLPLPACGAGKGMAFGSLFPALLNPCQLGPGYACSPGPAAGMWGGLCGARWTSPPPPAAPQHVCGDQLSYWGQANPMLRS